MKDPFFSKMFDFNGDGRLDAAEQAAELYVSYKIMHDDDDDDNNTDGNMK